MALSLSPSAWTLSFHFFHLLSCCLSFCSGGWLMWVSPTIQAINVGLSMHLSSAHPSIQKLLRPSYLPTKTGTHLAHTSLVWLRFLHLRLDVFERDVWGLKLCILKKKKLGEKTYFLKPPLREKLWFHGVDYISSKSLKDKAQGRRDCPPFTCTTMGFLS